MILPLGYTFTPDIEESLASATQGELIACPWLAALAEVLDHLAIMAPNATADDVEAARRAGLAAIT